MLIVMATICAQKICVIIMHVQIHTSQMVRHVVMVIVVPVFAILQQVILIFTSIAGMKLHARETVGNTQQPIMVNYAEIVTAEHAIMDIAA